MQTSKTNSNKIFSHCECNAEDSEAHNVTMLRRGSRLGGVRGGHEPRFLITAFEKLFYVPLEVGLGVDGGGVFEVVGEVSGEVGAEGVAF